ncbi:MAG: CocE/NonD family hydrolase [Cyanobium sp. PLM2.Bin73]|nr:MAG: CocE/NonD family hydrolase [Cyanobium sp. PLM2.Bin73]
MHWRDARLTCRDGVELVSRIWQPPGPGPWPMLLMRQPYGRAIASTPVLPHPHWWARQGFLVVVQDVRGQGGSQGNFGGFAQEAADTADSLRWVRRLPGSNGRVGMVGFSYQGLTQLLSDAEDGDGLPDCLAPAMTGLDERLHWASSGGAHWWALGLGWGLQLAALQCRRRGDQQGWWRIRRSLESGTFLHEGPELLEQLDPTGMALRWLGQDPGRAEGWIRHEPPPALWQRPMLLIGGWDDPHLEGVLELWQRARQAGGSPLLRIGAWTHLNWHGGIDAQLLRFFQQQLQPGSSGAAAEAPVLVQDPRDGQWWPLAHPAAAAGRRWRLSGQALVPAQDGAEPAPGPQPAPADNTHWLVHDPWRPVPGRGGHLGLDAGPCERSDLDQRRDVACFTSTPLEHPVRLLARPRLRLRVAADQPGFDLCAALARVDPQGTALQLCTGVSRQLGDGCLQPDCREVVLQPLLLHLQPGERLRLSLAAAAWPQVAVNPGSGEPPWGGSGPDHRVVTLELHGSGAELRLDPLEALDGGAEWGLPRPVP